MKDKKKLEDFLNKKPSYIKKGSRFLSELLEIDEDYCRELISPLRKEYDLRISLEKKTLNDRNEIELAAVQHYISQGDYKKAGNLIKNIEKGNTTYSNPNVKSGTYIVMGCMHFPFHNKRMWDALLKIISDVKKLRGIILAGDILDMHSISRHAKGKITLPEYNLTQEYEETNIILDQLDQAIGDKEIIKEYFYGNHEDWFNQWGAEADNWKLGEAGAVSPYNYCFKKRGYMGQFNWKTAKVMIGDIKIIHGEWTNIHSAYKHMMQLHQKVVFFHTHRFNTYYESNLYGLNCGWGGDKESKVFNYMSESGKSKWRNGFCEIEVTNQGTFARGLPFENGKFYYKNKVY